jgi:hypothetical protein
MQVPVSLPMLGRSVQIKYVAELGGDYGHADPPTFTIKIAIKEHSSAAEVFSTLLHEMLHIALGTTGQAELFKGGGEEALVVALENALAPLVQFKALGRWRDVKFPWERGYGK